MKNPAEIQILQEKLRRILPAIELQIDSPDSPSGQWWLDFKLGDRVVVISWTKMQGFGLYLDDEGYGSRPTEIYRDAADLTRRIDILQSSITSNGSAYLTAPNQIRQLCGLTQIELADRLNIKQPSISRLEARDDFMISSLIAYCEAMDIRLELRAFSKSMDVPIFLFNSEICRRSDDSVYLPMLRPRGDLLPNMSLLVLKVLELEIVKRFYEVIGMRFQRERHGSGPIHYACSTQGNVFEIYPVTKREDVTYNATFGFTVPSIVDAMSSLKDAYPEDDSIKFSENAGQASVIDPAGTRVLLYEGAAS